MNGHWAVAAGICLAAGAILKDIFIDTVKEEAITRLNRIPVMLIRIATARVPAELRDDLSREWRAELSYIASSTEGLPLTRLLRGIRYAAGLLRSAAEVSRELAPCTSRARQGTPLGTLLGWCLITVCATPSFGGIIQIIRTGIPAAADLSALITFLGWMALGIGLALPGRNRLAACEALAIALLAADHLITGGPGIPELLIIVPVAVATAELICRCIPKSRRHGQPALRN